MAHYATMESLLKWEASGAGRIHDVVGDVTSHAGMRYENKEQDAITRSTTYHHHHEVLGYVKASRYRDLEALLRACQTPPQQKAYNPQRNATEPFKNKAPLVFYTADELKDFRFPRLKKCKWWVEEQAKPALEESKLLTSSPPAT